MPVPVVTSRLLVPITSMHSHLHVYYQCIKLKDQANIPESYPGLIHTLRLSQATFKFGGPPIRNSKDGSFYRTS